ncbi:MAG: choice-of-anchor D domain-containing protein, partial [Candidatus Kapaibacterium sp.]
SQVTYHFAIFEVLPGQAPIAAFRGARPLFVQDVPNLTDLLWPTQYFLPEKGKIYTWSVQALDSRGNPFVLENNGWATPFTFTVGSDCDVNGNSGLLISPQVLDFGSVPLKSGPITKQITLQNIGNEPLNLQLPVMTSGAQSGFSLSSPPSTPILSPATSATFDVTFNPTQIGMADGSVRIASDGGTATVQLKGQGVDAASPTIKILYPAGGESFRAGSPVKIQFSASDNDALSNYAVQYSVDGGTTFPGSIKPADNSFPKPPEIVWNIPDDLQTSQGIIKITAQDKGGNTVSALSGLFSIGTATGLNSDSSGNGDIKTKNTNMTDVFIMRRDQNSFTFVPLALEVLTPAGTSAIDFPKDFNTLSRVAPGSEESAGKVNLDIPTDLLENSNSANTGGGILISGADRGGLDGSTMRYVVQYRETDFSFTTPGKGTITSTDANGNSVNASVIYPESADFVDGESFLHPPVPPPTENTIGSATSGAGSGKIKIEISSLTGGSGESPITAYFNPKEITIDKSISWKAHRNSHGDDPPLEFSAGKPAELSVELMFDGFEEKKSVKPDLQHFLHWLGIGDEIHSDKYGRVKVQFHWDREGKQEHELVGVSIKYSMFLPDGKPCRATVQLKMLLPDSNAPSQRWDSKMTPGTHHLMQFFSTDIGPQTLQYLQGNQFGTNPILHDPVFSDRERELRGALLKNLPAISNANVTFGRDNQKGSTKTQGDFNLSNRFTVEIEGSIVPGIHSIEGLKSE